MDATRTRFRELHTAGLFLLPNAWDVGSARILEALGFDALATTSGGHAASLGRSDMQVTRDELVAHVEALAAAVDLPVNVDAERCFAADPAGVAVTVGLLAEAGASGVSIEDWDPAAGRLDSVRAGAERVAAAAEVCRAHGIVLVARAENHLHRVTDLNDTITRLQAYRAQGADVLYAQGLSRLEDIERVVQAVGAPVNVLALPGTPSVSELAAAGVRRVSLGGGLAFVAYGAMAAAARHWQRDGTVEFLTGALDRELRVKAFTAKPT